MTGDTVYVDSIAGSANGPVRLSGTLDVGNWREPAFNLTFQAQDAELLNNDLGEMHANADLRITGPFAHANVAGRVSVVHGVLYIPEMDGKKLVGAGDPQLFSVVDTSVALERELFPARSRCSKGWWSTWSSRSTAGRGCDRRKRTSRSTPTGRSRCRCRATRSR